MLTFDLPLPSTPAAWPFWRASRVLERAACRAARCDLREHGRAVPDDRARRRAFHMALGAVPDEPSLHSADARHDLYVGVWLPAYHEERARLRTRRE